MNSENGLPPEVQTFMDTYLPTDEDKRLFLDTYRTLHNEVERAAFLKQYATEPTDAEIHEINQSRLN